MRLIRDNYIELLCGVMKTVCEIPAVHKMSYQVYCVGTWKILDCTELALLRLELFIDMLSKQLHHTSRYGWKWTTSETTDCTGLDGVGGPALRNDL